MKHRIRFYKQHTKETCGIACALILLDYYDRKVSYPTKKMEKKLYDIYKSKALKMGVSGARLAELLAKNNLDVRLVHSSENILENRDGYFTSEKFDPFLEEYISYLSKRGDLYTFEKGAYITLDTIKDELSKKRQLIVETIVPGDADGEHDHVLHWILVYGYKNGEFLIVDTDPDSYGKTTLTEDEMAHYMDTPIGKIFVSVGDK
ncbi:MAG: hypothetical protein IJ017_01625 [Oscillospiraceae bacterium]|nr:hypothetical protein [Oscillospiraceae bacterium]